MTLKEAQEVLENWKCTLGVRPVKDCPYFPAECKHYDSKVYKSARTTIFIESLLEAARVVERERSVTILRKYGCVCGRSYGSDYVKQQILSDNQEGK